MDQRFERYHRRQSSAPGEAGRVGGSDTKFEDGSPADEASAEKARRRLRERGIVAIEPDDCIGVLLAPSEKLVAVRRSVRLERRQGQREAAEGLAGDLYVTTRRLVHLGRLRVDYGLSDITDAVEAPGALRLIVGEERGIQISVPDPRVLRVEIAAVREAAHAAASIEAGTRDDLEE